MGRQAKLKKIRKEAGVSDRSNNCDPNNFIDDLERRGYQLKQIQRSPDLPDNKIEPKI